MTVYKTAQVKNFLSPRSCGCKTGSGKLIFGIEDIVGNGLELVDGIVFRTGDSLTTSTISYETKISDYKNGENITTNQTTLTGAVGSDGGFVTEMYYKKRQTSLEYFAKTLSGSANTYYCDNFYIRGAKNAKRTEWGWDQGDDGRGLFYLGSTFNWSDSINARISARLHAKKLS